MTKEQAGALICADDEKFPTLASEYGFEVAGPSFAGFFLTRVRSTGKAFLFTPYPEQAKIVNRKRTFIESVWSQRTLQILKATDPEEDSDRRRERSASRALIVDSDLLAEAM